jgi:hypothetical protein
MPGKHCINDDGQKYWQTNYTITLMSEQVLQEGRTWTLRKYNVSTLNKIKSALAEHVTPNTRLRGKTPK